MVRALGLGLVLSMRLDGRKDIQYAKLALSIHIQSLEPVPYLIFRGIVKDVKQTPTQTHVWYI